MTKLTRCLLAVSGTLLGACMSLAGGSGVNQYGFLDPVPDTVLALAAPYQNLDAVVLRPEDGCLWYQHDGPVEITLLPLRTEEGRAICTQSQPSAVGDG